MMVDAGMDSFTTSVCARTLASDDDTTDSLRLDALAYEEDALFLLATLTFRWIPPSKSSYRLF